jgi:hypothetical protein
LKTISCSRTGLGAAWSGTALATSLLIMAGCGGGGGDDSWLYPLWVPTDVRVADIDGDGRADVLTVAQLATSQSAREGRLVVRLQMSPGVFAPARTYVVGVYPWRMALGDIDGDGAPDLVLTDVGGPATTADNEAVWMLLQDRNTPGQFLAPQRLAVDPVRPYDVAIGDVSGDQVPDIVVADSLPPGRGATLLVQDGGQRGSFLSPALIPLPGDATRVAIGNVNGDDLNDLVFRMFLSQTDFVQSTALGVVYQQPGGVLAPAVSLSPQTGLNTATLAIAHYDGNGLADVVEFFTPGSTQFQAKLTTLLQTQPDSLAAVDTSLAGVNGIDGGVVADLDGDGRPDFASVGFYPVGSPSTVHSTLNLFIQDGSGGFSLTASIAMPISASRLAAGDIDGDGLNDLVALGAGNPGCAVAAVGHVAGNVPGAAAAGLTAAHPTQSSESRRSRQSPADAARGAFFFGLRNRVRRSS